MADYNKIEDCLKRSFVSECVIDSMKTIAGLDFLEKKTVEGIEDKSMGSHVIGCVVLNGEKSLIVMVSMITSTANVIVSCMSRTDLVNMKKETLCDGIMEITNILSGRFKSLLAQGKLAYNLSAPFVIYGDDFEVLLKKMQKGISYRYKAGLSEMDIRILFL